MQEITKTLLSKFGVTDEDFQKLSSEDAAPEVADEIFGRVSEVSKINLEKELRDAITEDVRNSTYAKSVIKALNTINEKFELGLANSDIKSAKIEDVLDQAKEKFAAKKPNDNKEVEGLKQKLDEISSISEKEKEALVNEYESKINELQATITNFHLNNEFSKSFDKISFGCEAVQIPAWKKTIMNEIGASYQIGENGALKAIDGTPALNPEKTKKWEKLDDAVEYFIDKYKLRKVSGASEEFPTRTQVEAKHKEDIGGFVGFGFQKK